MAGGAARPGGKSVSPKCARRLPPASFGGLPPRGGRPAPPRGSEEDPGGGPCCTGEGAANEPSATQHDEGHNPGTPRDSERAKPSQIRATPQPPRSGATATGGRRQDSAGGRGRGPQVRRRPGFGQEPLRMSVLKRGCAVSLFPLRFAPSNSCQRLRKAAACSSLSSCECPLKHVVLLWQQVQNKGAHACSKATQHSRIRASLCLAPAAEGSKVLRQEDKSSQVHC